MTLNNFPVADGRTHQMTDLIEQPQISNLVKDASKSKYV